MSISYWYDYMNEEVIGLYTDIKATYTWNYTYIYTPAGADSIYLLIEWNALEPDSKRTSSISKPYARDVELNIWFESVVQVVAIYGYKGHIHSSPSSLKLDLGNLYINSKQSIIIEFSFKAHANRKRSVLSTQWRYKGATSNKIREQAIEELYMNYTFNPGLVEKKGNFKVEKQVKLLTAPSILREAIAVYERGDIEHAKFLVRRKGDELLLFAIRSGDLVLMKEAEKLYHFLDNWGESTK